jgi:hypothetical protein
LSGSECLEAFVIFGPEEYARGVVVFAYGVDNDTKFIFAGIAHAFSVAVMMGICFFYSEPTGRGCPAPARRRKGKIREKSIALAP